MCLKFSKQCMRLALSLEDTDSAMFELGWQLGAARYKDHKTSYSVAVEITLLLCH